MESATISSKYQLVIPGKSRSPTNFPRFHLTNIQISAKTAATPKPAASPTCPAT